MNFIQRFVKKIVLKSIEARLDMYWEAREGTPYMLIPDTPCKKCGKVPATFMGLCSEHGAETYFEEGFGDEKEEVNEND